MDLKELNTKYKYVSVRQGNTCLHIVAYNFDENNRNIENIYLSFEHKEKLLAYKSQFALLKYAKANALPSPTLTALPSEVVSEGNPSPVAVSAPTASDTPIPCTPTALCDECFDTPQEGEALCNACKIRKA